MKIKKFKHYQSRYSDVCIAVNKGKLLTLTEIREELLKSKTPVDMSLQGIKKNLNLMRVNHQVIYLDVKKNAKRFTKRIFPRTYTKKFNKYYLATPKTGKLFGVLFEKAENLNNTKKYIPLVEDVIDHYTSLELGSIFTRKRFADEKLIHSVIKEKKKHRKDKRVFKKEVLGVKAMAEDFLKSNWKFKEVKLKVPVKEIVVQGKKYFLVNDELVPVSKLMEFMKLLELDPFMKWAAYIEYPWGNNKKNTVIPAIKAMKDLFVEIVKDSQVKV